MEAPRVTDVTELRAPAHRVSPRAVAMWRCSAGVEGAVACAVLSYAALKVITVSLPWWSILIAALLVCVWVAVVPPWRFRVHRWETTDTAVYTQTGWWAIEQRIAPMSRIQTVEYEEGPIERLFGLASVQITTASVAGTLRISGLDKTTARTLASQLTEQADAVAGDAT